MVNEASKQKTAIEIVVLAFVYTVVAKLGLGLDAVSGFATLVWPATGIALAALLLFGSRVWPGVFIGAWIVNVWVGGSAAVALAIAAGNTMEALLGAYVMRRLAGFRGSFDSVRHVVGLIVGAAAISTVVSATVGVVSLAVGGVVTSAHQAVETWRAWWVGDGLGDLVVAPVLLTLTATRPRHARRPAMAAEAVSLIVLLSLTSCAVFFAPLGAAYRIELPYVIFPLLVWAGMRFELRGAAVATALASTLAICGTVRGSGPFAQVGLASALLALQTFMASAAITPLVVAGATMDRARAIREQETFVATVSHDLKNPLHALVLSAEYLATTNAEPFVQQHYKVVKRSFDRMMRLITNLLDASAIERGQFDLDRTLEDVGVLVNETLDLMGPLATAKKLTLQVESDEAIAALLDRDRVLHVLENLIGNAIKFAPDGSAVTIRVTRAVDVVQVSIQDHGPGITPQELRHLFEPYWHTRSTVGGGTGLGLFIAYGIVVAHGGKLWVESTPGAGSTFYFTIPASGTPRA